MRVFERGDLARVMRASMSVPGAFAPVQIDGQLYVDGGLVRNLPVDVARATCADVVIAVNLGTPLGKRDQLKSVFAVALQSVNLMTELNVSQSLTSLKETDVLITPELTGISSSDFARLRRGDPEAGAKPRAGVGAGFSPCNCQSRSTQRGWRRGRAGAPRRSRSPRFGSRPTPGASIRRSSRASSARSPAKRSRAQSLDSDLKRLFGRGDFDQVDYSLVDEDGKRAVVINAIGEILGTQLHQVRARSVHGLPGRAALQSAWRAIAGPGSTASARNGAPMPRWASPTAS